MNDKKNMRLGFSGEGMTNEFGAGGRGRMTLDKEIAKNLELQAYLEGQAFKPKEGKTNRELTNAGLKLTKRFKSGGMISASKRADGCARKGKTKGRMV